MNPACCETLDSKAAPFPVQLHTLNDRGKARGAHTRRRTPSQLVDTARRENTLETETEGAKSDGTRRR